MSEVLKAVIMKMALFLGMITYNVIYSSILNMEESSSSETSLTFYQAM
jgi:hypothetical protein